MPPLRLAHERCRERWVESWSSDAASRSASSGAKPSSATTSSTSGVPSVSVPVLSSRTVCASPSCSITPPPLTITPARAARDTPAMNAIGAARISGHGVATTSTATARTGSPLDDPRGAGDEQRDRQEDRRVAVGEPDEGRLLRLGLANEPDEGRVGALGRRARGAQLEGVGRVRGAAARRPPRRIVRGSGSPVSADSSTTASSETTTPSTGTTSPARTTTTSPTSSSSTGISSRVSPRRRVATRGARSIRAVSSRRARPAATSSSALPPASISAITAPARYSPIASAPAIATSAIASTPTSRCRSVRTTDQVSGTSMIADPAAQTAFEAVP